MGKQDFDRMLNISRAKESLRKKSGEYRKADFGLIFEFSFRLVISQEVIEYMEEIGIDLIIDWKNMDVCVINERYKSFDARNLKSILEIKRGMEKLDVFRFGVFMEVYHSIRQHTPITNDKTYMRTEKRIRAPYTEKNQDLHGKSIFNNCWVYIWDSPFEGNTVNLYRNHLNEEERLRHMERSLDKACTGEGISQYGMIEEVVGKKKFEPVIVKFSDLSRTSCMKETMYDVRLCYRRRNPKIDDTKTRRPIGMREGTDLFNKSYERGDIDPKLPYREKNQERWFCRKILNNWLWTISDIVIRRPIELNDKETRRKKKEMRILETQIGWIKRWIDIRVKRGNGEFLLELARRRLANIDKRNVDIEIITNEVIIDSIQ
jgi:hypothetical protein